MNQASQGRSLDVAKKVSEPVLFLFLPVGLASSFFLPFCDL